MSKIHDEIAMCAQLEQHRYILSEFLKNEQQLYKSLESKNPKPKPPQQPGSAIVIPYPHYDEKRYYEKIKDSSPVKALTANGITFLILTLACIPGIWTMIFIPFTLLISISCFLLIPIVKRKSARKAYIQECEQIDYRNRSAQAQVEQYQKDCVEYERKLQLYEARSQNVQIQKKMFNNSIENAKKALSTISTRLSNYYAKSLLNVYGRNNNYIAIVTIYSYLQSGQCNTLESAIEKFNIQKQLGKISPTIEYALNNRSITKESMGAVIASLDDAQRICNQLCKDSIQYFTNLLDCDTYCQQPSPIDTYCDSILRQS